MKVQTLAAQLRPMLDALRCPLCASALTLREEHSVVCENGHCFDLSAKGYVNFVPSRDQKDDKYDAELFASRTRVLEGGFYTHVLDALCEECNGLILDAGCGEGHYARHLAERLPNSRVIGVDLSRDAIQAATRLSHAPIWLIGDLTRLPIADHCIDTLVDVLTPADYGEFRRVLRPDGLLLKVIPANDYLCEIRAALGDRLGTFDNSRVIEHLKQSATILRQTCVRRVCELTQEQSADFLRMTPMTFGIGTEELRAVSVPRVTVAMELLVCRLND